jgi:hypothetical protein
MQDFLLSDVKIIFRDKELSLDEVSAFLRNPMSLTDGTDKLLADFILPSDYGNCFVVFSPQDGGLSKEDLRQLLEDTRPVVGVEPTHRCKFDSAHQDKPLCPLAYRLCHSPCDVAV